MSGHTSIEPPQGAWPYQLKRSDGAGLYEPPVYEPKHPVLRWFELRLPIGGSSTPPSSPIRRRAT